ncbi:RNA methyltransferase [Thermosipho melanesiensis]|uniref:RNA methyltransferase n=2 Tax=Thermosipho melanesiensis TaxID=46541 RepID=A0ABM6GCP2_9BACT|nr:RNA methyltransferase [Thermosipho melanesiensis]ABR30057.1 putative RNA methylase [Thermosipho melanesiensis BI429]APT73254.1 RNA methyltransferase [Thermosipho melanesiensis]OOC38650.1 RNA methyltransferase [Thermosipho melanesiensis]OOC40454.1 RNA methyltransferase [Thermosipho melanesiensis]OOC40719.1 RNA methyltransferase [Thermosipho melanesiensis]
MTIVLTCTSGLEAATALEVKNMGYKVLESVSGKIYIKGDLKDIPLLNIHLRSAERVFILLKKTVVKTFDEFYKAIYEIDWEDFVHGKVYISDVSVRNSKLSAKGAIISVAYAAIRKKVKSESNVKFPVRIILKNDVLYVLLDTTGEKALSKRGYRLKTSKAPLRETIAASLILLSRWKNATFIDPFCGSGTIPIEAALIKSNTPPGIFRSFVSENWNFLNWPDRGKRLINVDEIYGFDLDEEIIKIAKENAKRIGIKGLIFEKRLFGTYNMNNVWIVTNPPYGERLSYNIDFSKFLKNFEDSKFYILFPNRNFEKMFGKKATKKIRFQNSGIWVWFYMYY